VLLKIVLLKLPARTTKNIIVICNLKIRERKLQNVCVNDVSIAVKILS